MPCRVFIWFGYKQTPLHAYLHCVHPVSDLGSFVNVLSIELKDDIMYASLYINDWKFLSLMPNVVLLYDLVASKHVFAHIWTVLILSQTWESFAMSYPYGQEMLCKIHFTLMVSMFSPPKRTERWYCSINIPASTLIIDVDLPKFSVWCNKFVCIKKEQFSSIICPPSILEMDMDIPNS